jgi:hypothetical protein
MRPLLLSALSAIPLLLLAGCQSGNTELLERELRLQEDKIYQLQFELEDCCKSLEDCGQENAALRERTGTSATTRTAPAARTDRSRTRDAEPDTIEPPRVELGTPDEDGAGSDLYGPSADDFEGSLSFPKAEILDGSDVTSITLDRPLARLAGENAGKPKLVLGVKPRGDAGQTMPAAGDVAIVVLDETQQDNAGHIARWDFTTKQAATKLRKTSAGPQMRFELDLPTELSESDAKNLRVYVRFLTPDGRKLQADAPLGAMVADARQPSGRKAQRSASRDNSQARQPSWSPYR